MLGTSDLVAFVLTADAARAKAFYGETLGLRFVQQDETGVWTAPGGDCKVAWFKDPDGNTLSLTQS